MHPVLPWIYARSPIWLQNLMTSSYGAYLHRRRYGGACQGIVETLVAHEHLSRDEILEIQMRLLGELMDRCVPLAPWYARLAGEHGFDWRDVRTPEDLRRIPILEKEAVRRDPRAFVAGYPRGESIYESSTSGTSGTPMTIYMNRTSDQLNYAFYLRQMNWMGVRMGEARATFFGRIVVPPTQESPPFWRFDRSENNWQFSSYHISPKNLPHYVSHLATIRPVEIRGYPSSLAAVAVFLLNQNKFLIRPRAIQTTAETLTPDVKALLVEAFRAPVFDQYGSSEMSHFITTCEHGTYHEHPEYGIVEVLTHGSPTPPGELGEVIATSFVNLCMPFVRYRIGDLIEPSATRCACGRPFGTFARVVGRQDDVIVTPDGRRIGRLDPAFKGVAGILESQVEQTEPGTVVLRVVPAPGYRPQAARVVAGHLSDRLGPTVRVQIEELASLPRGAGGKLRSVIGLAEKSKRSAEVANVGRSAS